MEEELKTLIAEQEKDDVNGHYADTDGGKIVYISSHVMDAIFDSDGNLA